MQNTDHSDEDLAIALAFANRWSFNEAKSQINDHLRRFNLGPIRRLQIAQSHGLADWLYPAYEELALREDPPSADEAAPLGIDFIAKMALVRERMFRHMLKGKGTTLQSSAREAIASV